MRPRPYLKLLTKAGPLVALTLAIGLMVGTAGPASAQFFNFGGPSRPAPHSGSWFGRWFGGNGGFFAPNRPGPVPPRRVYQDFSKAPPPEKRDTVPKRTVLVLGDSMADWLAYGLEDAYVDQPDIGILRKVKTVSGLIQYQPRGAPADWIAAAKDILATEKPDVIVVMLGLSDRISIHEPAPEKTEKQKKSGKNERKPDKAADAKSQADGASETGAKPEEKADDSEAPPDDDTNADTPEKHPRSPNGIAQFHDERWIELYNKKIDEMIAALKSKGVPVVWVGLPAVRGAKGTADTLFLDSLYRGAADKAGITYVDVWDGFVDEAGRFVQKGPDFEGQIRQLRTYDGVYFTKYGARKLAHYVEREVTRLLAARSGPIALPTEPATPDTKAAPGQPAPRPLAGPIVPLVAASVSTDQLLGGPGSRPAPVDALAAQTLVKGEPLAPPPGRADDFAWPRRQIGDEPAKGDVPVAATTPTAPAAPPHAAPAGTSANAASATPKGPPKPSKPLFQQQQQHKPTQSHAPSLMNFFGFGSAPTQPAPARPPRPPRPPANVGRSAGVP